MQAPVLVHALDDIQDWNSKEQFIAEGRVFKLWLNELVALLKLQNRKVGLKLDFKVIDPVEKTMQIINELENILKDYVAFVWINADVLEGPRGPACRFVEEKSNSLTVFMKICDEFTYCGEKTNVVISVGWTTGPVKSGETLGYSEKHVDDMLELLRKFNFLDGAREITFPVRGCDIMASLEQMSRLLKGVDSKGNILLSPEAREKLSLTIWVGEESLSDEEVQNLIEHFGLDKLFIDIPGYIRNRST